MMQNILYTGDTLAFILPRDIICYTSFANVIICSLQRDVLYKFITPVEGPNTTRNDSTALKSPVLIDLISKLIFF